MASGETYKPSSKDEILGLCGSAVLGTYDPFSCNQVEVSPNYNGIECAVFLDANYFVNVIKARKTHTEAPQSRLQHLGSNSNAKCHQYHYQLQIYESSAQDPEEL
ncbi:hypothetical protein MKX08_008037 [Trichoderma sp. CBMAI-0020]|nr:hypothetical protein MKX08_008037 [Trichoderma sp. CBMAI-0020]WOD45574.1 hypothetical protein [Trichoderma atroviride]